MNDSAAGDPGCQGARTGYRGRGGTVSDDRQAHVHYLYVEPTKPLADINSGMNEVAFQLVRPRSKNTGRTIGSIGGHKPCFSGRKRSSGYIFTERF